MHHGIYSQGHSAVLPFGPPPAYADDHLLRDLVPLLRKGGVHLVVNGHNHVVNHRIVDGIHYVESSHGGTTFEPYARGQDGSWAREPHGHPSRLLIHEPGVGYLSVLETCGPGRLTTYRVDTEGPRAPEPVDRTELGFPESGSSGRDAGPAGASS
jgi:hypothetical protein